MASMADARTASPPSRVPVPAEPAPAPAPAATNLDASTPTLPTANPDADAEADLDEKWRIYDLVSEEYHDIVTELPLDYQRTFMLIKELDDEQQSHTAVLKTSLTRYLTANAPTVDAFDVLARDHELARRACEDKVTLALALYDSVDRHIQRLDADLARYEDQLVVGLRTGTEPTATAPAKLHGQGRDEGAIAGEEVIASEEHEAEWNKVRRFDAAAGRGGGGGGGGGSRQRATTAAAAAAAGSNRQNATAAQGPQVIGMPKN
ncbi:hypothetical protein JCM11491_001612 [Sporobolomyces phaffii]